MSTSNITLYITQFSLKNKIFITFSNIPKVKNICVCVCLHICVCLPITSIGEREKLIVEQYLSTLLKGHYPLVQNQGNVGLFHRYCSIHCSSIHCFLSNAGQEKPFFINKYLSKIKEKHFFLLKYKYFCIYCCSKLDLTKFLQQKKPSGTMHDLLRMTKLIENSSENSIPE